MPDITDNTITAEPPAISNELCSPSEPVSGDHSMLVKQRLAAMFRRVPEVMAADTIEAKLQNAADTLAGEHFFCSCVLYAEDPEQGIVSVQSGAPRPVMLSSPDRYAQLRASLGSGVAVTLQEECPGGQSRPVVVVPIKNHDGRMIGLAELCCDDESLASEEMLELISVFLMETAQSVEQFWLECELERKEATYRSLIDNVSDIIFRTDLDGRVTFISRQVQDLLGISWKEALGESLFRHVAEHDLERAQHAFREAAQGRPVRLDCHLLRPGGGEITVFVSANPIIEGGVVVGVLGVARDVTEKRRLEDQIQESERRYRALTENAYDAILLVDPQTLAIVDSNPQAEKLTGYDRAELLRMSVADLRRSDHAEAVRDRIRYVMQVGAARFEDTPVVRKDGTEVEVDTAASVYELEGKRYYQAIVRDNSAQKQMHMALSQRVMELQILSEVSDALQSAVDLQSVMGLVLTGVTAGAGLGFNRAFVLSYDSVNNELRGEAGLGPRTAEEAGAIWSDLERRGLKLGDILEKRVTSYPQEAEQSYEFARNLVVTLDEKDNVFTRAIRNRETLCVNRARENPHLPEDFLRHYGAQEFAIVPLVTREDVIGVLLVDNLFTQHAIQDQDLHRLKLFANSAASAIERSRLLVSLEKRLHELTLTNQDLKDSRDRLIQTERLSAIGEVAASVAHEIRNPLTAIGGFARSVFSSLGEDDKNRRKVQIILEETDRLEHMLSSLLEFTRPAVPRFTELDVNALILQTVHFMGTEIEPETIRVHYRLDPELPRAWADSQQIRQVLLNIVRNALQEMRQGGELTLTTASEGEEEIRISVRDTGPGIKPENMDRLFEAFFTTKPAGSGLGLAICGQIMRNHNGRIEASSPPGEGATFSIILPAAQKPLDSH